MLNTRRSELVASTQPERAPNAIKSKARKRAHDTKRAGSDDTVSSLAPLPKGYTREAAEKTGLDVRTIQRDIKIGSTLNPDVLPILKGTKAENSRITGFSTNPPRMLP